MSEAPPSLFVATPCYGGQAFTAYITSILALQRGCIARGIGLQIALLAGDALISRGRATLAATFLASAHSHMIFIDADIGFAPEQVFRLIESGLDLVGGVYPAKRIDWDKAKRAWEGGYQDVAAASHPYVVRFLPDLANSVELDDRGFGEVAYVGTGFMMIRRAALQRLADAHPELRARHADLGTPESEATMLFETMIEPETGQYLSEDYAFCRRWRDIGGTIHADFRGSFSHVGYTVHHGGLEDAARR